MRNLSDTIARLSAMRGAKGLAPGGSAPDRLTDLADFGSNPGALRARTYLPQKLERNAPLVVVLHGCTQNAAGYDHGSGWSQFADEHGFAVLFPEQQRSNNANLCFNWFEPGDTRRGQGEALSISQMIEALVGAHGLDRQRIYVTGLSAGGAMAGVMLATYPELFAAGAIIAGLPHGSASTIPEAFDRMRGQGGPSEARLQEILRAASPHAGPWPRLSVWQGSADRTVHPSNAAAIIGQWRGVHAVPAEPSRTEKLGPHARRVWLGADGRELIEEYAVAGMGHGTPLGDDGLGTAAPYMLDVGLSSTACIARFWGIAGEGTEKRAAKPASAPEKAAVNRDLSAEAPRSRPEPQNPAPAPEVGGGVRKIIEDALRSAGLMR